MNITKIKQHMRAALIAYAIVTSTIAFIYLIGSNGDNNEYVMTNYPVLSQSDSLKLAREIRSGLDAKPQTATEYFRLLETLTKLEMAETRARYVGQRISHPLIPSTRPIDTRELLQELTNLGGQIADKDYAAWTRASNLYGKTDIVRIQNGCVQIDLSGFFRWLLIFHFGGAILAFALRLVKAKENGASLLLETVNIYAWRDGLLWQYYAWRNPAITLQQQLAMLWKVLTSAFAGSISLFGAIKGSAQDKPQSETELSRTTLVLEKAKVWPAEEELSATSTYDGYFVARRFHKGVVMQNSLTVTHKPSGFFMSLWGSTSVTNRQRGDFGKELDFKIGWAGKWLGLNLGADFNIISAQPLNKWPAGDVGVASLRVGTRLFGQCKYSAEPYGAVRYSTPLAHGGPGRGWLAEGGMNHSVRLRGRLTLSGGTGIVMHTQLYGFPSGAHTNFDVSLDWKLTNHLTIKAPSGKSMQFLTRSGDGQKTLSNVSVGFKYAW